MSENKANTGSYQIPRVDLGFPELTEDVYEGMLRVEALLRGQLAQGESFIVDKVMHLAEAGGKRFRPMFALIASTFGPRPYSDEVIKAAVLVEMTHLATLYHDDVMDEAHKRRGVDSANYRWNNSVAILAGDFLLAHTSRLMAELGVATVAHFADTFGELVTGQMRETLGAQGRDPIEHYSTVIREKTGVLIASAGYLGALHSGAPESAISALKKYGYAVGMIFQIADDVIDIFSAYDESGKNRGTDLKEGVFTLPVLYGLAEDSPIGDALRAELTGPVPDDRVDHVLDLLAHSEARQRCMESMNAYLVQATEALALLPETPAKKALLVLAQATAQRHG